MTPSQPCLSASSAVRPVSAHHRSFTKTALPSASVCRMPTGASVESSRNRCSLSARAEVACVRSLGPLMTSQQNLPPPAATGTTPHPPAHSAPSPPRPPVPALPPPPPPPPCPPLPLTRP